MISLLAALFFLVPVVVAPFTLDLVELNKQTVFVIFTAIACLVWLAQAFRRRSITLRFSRLFFFPLAFLVSLFVSSLLSSSYALSFLGASSQEYMSFLTGATGVIFLFLIVQTVRDLRSERTILTLFLVGSLFVALTTILSLFGLSVFAWLPGDIFSSIGSYTAAGLFLIIATLIAQALLTFDHALHRPWFVILAIALTAPTLLLLVLLDVWVLWVILGMGSLILMTLSMRIGARVGFLFALSLFFLFANVPLPRPAFPTEISPSFGTTWSVVKETFRDPETSLWFGTGPGTFVFNFTEHRPVELNATDFWNVRFDRGFSHTLTLLASIGIVGLALIGFFILTVLARVIMGPLAARSSQHFPLTATIFTGWLPLLAAMDLYPSNMTMQVLFWGLTGLLLAKLTRQEKTYRFSDTTHAGMIFTFAAIVLSVGLATLILVTGQRYGAEVVFAKAVVLDSEGADTNELITALDQAAALNRWSDLSYRALAEALRSRIEGELNNGAIAPERAEVIQELIAAAVAAAKRATDLSPQNVANWEVRGEIYETISASVSGADDFAIETYTTAHELEPNSPVHLTSLARSYMNKEEHAISFAEQLGVDIDPSVWQAQREEYLRQAESLLLQAIELKADYGSAHFELALVYEKQGRLAEAVAKMESVKQYHPNDVGVAFQLGALYTRQGKYEAAQTEFERAILLVPSYVNAHWYLAALHELRGDVSAAIVEVEYVLLLEPENEMVKAKLARLQEGLASTTVPEPIEE